MIGTINSARARRGVIFLVNIGAPLLVGASTGQSQAALAAAIVGMRLVLPITTDRCWAGCGFCF